MIEIIIDQVTVDLVNAVPIRAIRMCPVVRFAVNRTAKVIGRTIFLTNSIIHKKGFRKVGDPAG